MPRPPLSVTLITLNEAGNIRAAIESVQWADEIIVVDSGSTDPTLEIASEMGARVFRNPWLGYGQQKNFAQNQATHDWVLNIDADERVPDSLAQEICLVLEKVQMGGLRAVGFSIPRKTYYLGRWIKYGGWYPNYLVRLAHRKSASWTEPQVHEELRVGGPIEVLRNPLDHESFPSIHHQVMTNLNFSKLGGEELKRTGQRASYGKLLFKPVGKFLETYLLKRGFLDGLPGFIISVNAAHSIFLKYAYLFEAKIKDESARRRQ